MGRRILIGLFGIAGLGLAGLAFLANLFGLDRDNSWGPGRIIVAVVGVSLLLITLLIVTWQLLVNASQKVKGFCARLIAAFLGLPVVQKSWHTIHDQFDTWKVTLSRLPAVQRYLRHIKPQVSLVGNRIRNSRPIRYFTGSQDRMAALVAAILGVLVIAIYVW